MSITPLDLQTIFIRQNDVGKEQNHLKEAVASQQAAGAKQIKEDELRQDHSVNKTEEDHEDQQIKDDERKNQQERHESDSEKEDEKAPVIKKVFIDPEMGSHIDISG